MTVRVRRLVVAPAVSRITVQILPLLLLIQIATVHCAHVFDSYRVAQFDRQGAAFGSRRVTVNHVAVSSKVTRNTESMREKGGDLSRMLAVVRLAEASTEKLEELVDQRRASSVLILLPSESELPTSLSPDASQSSTQKIHASAVRDLEKYLLSREFDVPIYFAFEDQELQGVVDQLDANPTQEGATDRFQFVVSASEAAAVPSATVNNFQGWVHAAHSSAVDADSQSTIAVVASYDAFSAAPDLAAGADQSGSGVTALLEIARIFARLYSDYRTQGSTNLLFLLTGAGRFNYAGDKHWLSHVEPRVLDSIEFALCLDGLAGEKLHLHVSKPPKTPEIKALYETFRCTASSMGVPFEIVHKKINISNPVHDWQHELYSRKRIVSATLSSQPAPTPLFSGSSILDRASQINHDRLLTNIRFVAEALSKHVYRAHSKAAGKKADRRESEAEDDAAYSLNSQPVEGQAQSSQVIGHSHDVNPHVVGSWLQFLAAHPRAQPFLDKKSPVTAELEKTLAKYTADSTKTSFALDGEFTFYQSPEGRTQMSVYKVKPLLFDVFLAAAIGAYLFALYAATKYNSVSEIFGKSS